MRMHCSREGHDRVEMYLLDEDHESGRLTYKCPECGREEQQYAKAGSAPESERGVQLEADEQPTTRGEHGQNSGND